MLQADLIINQLQCTVKRVLTLHMKIKQISGGNPVQTKTKWGKLNAAEDSMKYVVQKLIHQLNELRPCKTYFWNW